MKYIRQYYYTITNYNNKDKNIDSVDKWRVNASVPILQILNANYLVPLFHMSRETNKNVET